MGTTIPEYKNRLRLARFLNALERDDNLWRAAFHAGFGSYAQFHRVVRAQTGDSPSALAQVEG